MVIMGLEGIVAAVGGDDPTPVISPQEGEAAPAVTTSPVEVAKSPGLAEPQASSTTTVASQSEAEAALQSANQRRVNIIWEVTQAVISISITAAFIYARLHGISDGVLDNATFMVLTFYLVRTNHVKIGGVQLGR